MSSLISRRTDFKRRAIQSSHNFFFRKLSVNPDDVYVTVFRGDKDIPLDKESIQLWRELGIPDKNIRMGGREENWWGPSTKTGLCGPMTEIYVDDVKVWSIVFNEYVKDADGIFSKSGPLDSTTAKG